MAVTKKTEETTTLDSDITKPSVTAPGDGPADTTDPTEIASTVIPRPEAEAFKVGTVNAVVKVGEVDEERVAGSKNHRFEEYDAVRPNGDVVHIKHNLDTGHTEIVGSSDSK